MSRLIVDEIKPEEIKMENRISMVSVLDDHKKQVLKDMSEFSIKLNDKFSKVTSLGWDTLRANNNFFSSIDKVINRLIDVYLEHEATQHMEDIE